MRIKVPKSYLGKLEGLGPLFSIIFVWILFFYPFFFKGLLPIPADITVGAYYPWLDYKWGYSVGVPIKNPLPSDIPSLVYPWRITAIQTLKNGELPLWNSSYFLGMPLLANFQSAVFSPANIFFVFMRESLAWSWGVVSQSVLMMFLMYLFLKNKKLSGLSSLLGAIIFSFSGFAVVWHQYNVHCWTILFLPLLLLAIDKFFTTSKIRWLLLLSFATAAQIFAGYLPIVIYSWLIIGIYLIFQKLIFRKEFLIFLIFVLMGFGLAAIQILPGLELINLSIRQTDPIVVASEAGYLPLRNLITLIVPNFFGNPATGNYWGKGFYDNFAFWIGIIPLNLAILAILNLKKSKEIIFWLFIIILGFVLSINNPLGGFLEEFLFLKGGVPARALFLVDFGWAVLCALGLEFLIRDLKIQKRALLLSLSLTAILLASFNFSLFLKNISIEQRVIGLRNSFFPWIELSIFTFSLFIFQRGRKVFVFLIISLVIFDLWFSAKKYWSFVPERLIFPKTPVIEFLQQQEQPFRFEPRDVVPQNMWMPYGLETVSGYDALLPKKQGEFLSLVEIGSILDKISRVQLLSNFQSPVFPLLNVKYLLAKKMDENGYFSPEGEPPSLFNDPRFKLVFEDKTVQVYEDLNVLPRAFLVYDYLVEKSNQEIVYQLLNPDFDLSKTVILEKNISLKKQKFDSYQDSVFYLDYSPQRSIIETFSEREGILFVADSFYPGWKVYIDGVEKNLYRANFVFRAVLVPAGNHEIKFIYDPTSFRWGIFISLAIFFIILGGSITYFFVGFLPNLFVKVKKFFA